MALIQYMARIQFASGARTELAAELGMLGVVRPLVMTDAQLVRAGVLAMALGGLAGRVAATFDAVPPNPTEACVLAALDLYRGAACDGIVAVGGGSVIDAAKAVALMATHPGPLADYRAGGPRSVTAAVAPVISIPTTAGTGSEIGRGLGITLAEGGAKAVFIGVHLIPKVAICDPDLTASMPPSLTAGTGIDALSHCLEAFLSPAVNPPADAVRAAQPAWAAAPVAHRAAVLCRWADAIEEARGRIGDAEAIDTGRSRVAHEVPMMVAAGLRGWAGRAEAILQSAQLSGHSTIVPGVTFRTQLVPYQLVGVISPWNHPFLLATIDAIPALLAGCAVLVKPSEIAPRFVGPVMDSLCTVPELASVLSFVLGGAETGQAIIANADAQCFTGSIATGRKVAEACARRFIPAFLELGGKDAAIVTASADLARAATAVVRGAVHNTGQICFATERVYVHARVHDRFVDAVVRECEALELTWPDPARGHIGPFILPRQAGIVDAQLDAAVSQGAVIRCGGHSERLGGGQYMRATVVTGVDHNMALMREETFGPVIPIMPYDTEEEALALANDSEFGLSGAVIAGSADEAARLGERMDAGAISLQDAALTIAILRDAEKTSFRFSGLGGSRMGPGSVLRFLRRKALVLHEGPTTPMHALGEAA